MRLEGDEIGVERAEQAERMAESEIDHVIRTVADPLVRKILTQRMNFVLGVFLKTSCRPDAEDLYQTVMLKVAGFLAAIEVKNQRPSQQELRGYVAKIAHNVCNDYLREKYPRRNRLKDRVRDLLRRHRDFGIWDGPHGMLYGFGSQRGRGEGPRAGELLREICERPAESDQKAEYPSDLSSLMAELFRRAGGPIEADRLIQMMSEILGVRDRPGESIDDLERSASPPSMRSNDGFDRVASQQLLLRIWQALCELTVSQRRAYLYIQTDYEGQSLLHVLVREQVVVLSEILEKLELSREELISVMGRVPMDTTLAAIELGTTNRLVAKWRHKAVKRVRSILEEVY